MRRLYLFVVLMIILLAACAPENTVLVTITPTETATFTPTATPLVTETATATATITLTPTVTETPGEATPTAEAYYEPVNYCSGLDCGSLAVTGGVDLYQTRRLYIPAVMEFVEDGERNQSEDCNYIPPYIYAQDTTEGLYYWEAKWVCGEWGLSQYVNLDPGRYIVKITYSKVRMDASEGEYWESGNFTSFIQLYASDGNSYTGHSQTVPMRDDDLEQVWVVQVESSRLVLVEWRWSIYWPSTDGSWVISDLEVLTAPDDYGDGDVMLTVQ